MNEEILQAWITATTNHAQATDKLLDEIRSVLKKLTAYLIDVEYKKILAAPPRRGMDSAQCYDEAVKRVSGIDKK